MDSEDIHKTAASTFKPKSLRNKAQEKMERIKKKEMEEKKQREARKNRLAEQVSPFKVNLKPTGINENASHSQAKKAATSRARQMVVKLKKTTTAAGKAKKTPGGKAL